ncbi:MAG: hypothetical protein CMI15_00950 [Opitutaceae bacterium]|nr:hypothetical protein [Opitutaceae bacterium]
MDLVKKTSLGIAFLAISSCWQLSQGAETEEYRKGEMLFALDVKPILSNKCFSCHGDDPEEIEGGLDMTTREGLLEGGESFDDVLIPGDAEFSFMMEAIRWEDPDYEMPPKETDRLSEEQIWSIRDWIKEGAPWPDDDRVAAIRDEYAEGVIVQTSGALSEDWANRRYKEEDLWAYQPIANPAVPETKSKADHPIDAFIDYKLELKDIPAAPLADRRTLIRRATFDLIGLPPAPEEVEDFVKDRRSDLVAFKDVIDRLLDDPRYGEQWGRHWLDVVRYADSSGFSNDYERTHAWRYRDYVIRSFNEDKPFDQFAIEQIAGDEWDPDNPEMIFATGFLRMGPWEHTSMSVAKITRQQFLDDVTDSVGQTFLSHPLQCARCHDHKFDPIPTKDYYRIQAVFDSTQFADRTVPFQPYENLVDYTEKAVMEKRIQYFDEMRKELSEKSRKATEEWCRENGVPVGTRRELAKQGIPDDKLPPRNHGLTLEELGIKKVGDKNVARTTFELMKFEPYAMSVYSGPKPEKEVRSGSMLSMPKDPSSGGSMSSMHILIGGDPFNRGEEVTPGVMSALPGSNDTIEATPWNSIPDSPDGRRLAFAKWLASPENTLVPRSITNRIWNYHFGRGIVNTPNNFGAMGGKPTHPELLDYLATWFLENDWSIKELHRFIMTSEAYRRSTEHPNRTLLTEKDPLGDSYAAFRHRRLSAEEVRDSMLRVSGSLSDSIGGLPARPEINMDVALQPRQVMGSYAASYEPAPTAELRNRRSIYAKKIRGLRNPFMEMFNQPSPDESCEVRQSSTVTPQVFSLFNSEDSLNRSVATAIDLLENNKNRKKAVEELFHRAYGRKPDREETKLSLDHWKRMEDRHEDLVFEPREFPREVERSAVEEMSGAPFTFTEVLFGFDDYSPDPTFADVDAETRALADLCLVVFNSNEFIYVY